MFDAQLLPLTGQNISNKDHTIQQNATYNHALKQITQIRKDLNEFESNLTSTSLSLQGTISVNISSLGKTIEDYETFGKNEIDEVKQEKFQTRLTNFKRDIIELKARFTDLKTQREESIQEKNRSELLRRNTVQQQASTDNPFSTNLQQQQQKQQQQSSMAYNEGLFKETNILQRGNAQLDEILEMGHQAMDELVHSNEIIRNFQRKLNGSLTTLGLSQETIRMIDKRAFQDKWIFYGLLVLFIVLCYFFWSWFDCCALNTSFDLLVILQLQSVDESQIFVHFHGVIRFDQSWSIRRFWDSVLLTVPQLAEIIGPPLKNITVIQFDYGVFLTDRPIGNLDLFQLIGGLIVILKLGKLFNSDWIELSMDIMARTQLPLQIVTKPNHKRVFSGLSDIIIFIDSMSTDQSVQRNSRDGAEGEITIGFDVNHFGKQISVDLLSDQIHLFWNSNDLGVIVNWMTQLTICVSTESENLTIRIQSHRMVRTSSDLNNLTSPNMVNLPLSSLEHGLV
ncbi:hypothetical protein WICPIJ_008687 [Wickerhamomyces pijperi]|uniref:t-SNARE coiled-coil homology domain-containing protein n=1 Tax=Wickerhamomyces pijperi TaxID=599730 RepID=A0A9P8TH00_WICPI|nr:hypothetical protein WICPIJ_008687 [Wickerhamomyces pijperi]